eukprot:GHVS01053293.1.p1 GENE.GHVS01053293.1~~GHVS01053293.1.p1  ORF type:complete len:369 (-),score=38.55 GHVS01053293.1:106-1191(-)
MELPPPTVPDDVRIVEEELSKLTLGGAGRREASTIGLAWPLRKYPNRAFLDDLLNLTLFHHVKLGDPPVQLDESLGAIAFQWALSSTTLEVATSQADNWERKSYEEVQEDCLQFVTREQWRNTVDIYNYGDYCNLMADYLVKKVGDHFASITSRGELLVDAIEKALHEFSSEKLQEIGSQDRKRFDRRREQSKQVLLLNGKSGRMSDDAENIMKVVWAEMDFETYGTVLHQTTREMLKNMNYDFCILWKSYEEESVSLRIVPKVGKNNDELANYLKKTVGGYNEIRFDQMTVNKEGWTKIKNALDGKNAKMGMWTNIDVDPQKANPTKLHQEKPKPHTRTPYSRPMPRRPKRQSSNALGGS